MVKTSSIRSKLLKAFKEAGLTGTTIKIKETEESKKRHQDVMKFIKLIMEAHKHAKNSKLHFRYSTKIKNHLI